VRGFLSLRDGMDAIPFQSDLERKFIVFCSCIPWVTNVTWEPLTIRFRDLSANRDRSYTPDFRVDFQTGSGETASLLIETKRAKDFARSSSLMAPCYAAADLFARDQAAMRFDLVSDDWLTQSGMTACEFIFQARKGAVPAADRGAMVQHLINDSGLTVASAIDRLAACGISNPNQAVATIMALVSDGYLGFDISEPVTLETPLYGKPIANPFASSIVSHAEWRQS
jgi:hypothetical protein